MGELVSPHGPEFVISTGDNFHPRGVASVTDPLWDSVYERVYAAKSLCLAPWYPFLGNHDHQVSVQEP
jgi:metallophosphoesterase superfamily enzyme